MLALGQELEGITVVSLEQAVAAPYCGLLLADAGARVIKVEREGGDFSRTYDHAANGESAYFIWLNGGKESIVLDIDKPEDAALLRQMLEKADVLLQNLAPGSLEKRGLSGEVLRRTNPALITLEITGYGRTGPYANMKAYDLLVQAESGLCSITGGPEEPSRVGISICDIATGLTAFSAILRALLLRGRTGTGVDISISMFDVLADWMNVPLAFQRYLHRAPSRLGVAHATLAPYGVYRAADGDVLIAVQSNREWVLLCERILDMPELASDPRFLTNMNRVENRDAMNIILNAVFETHTREELMARLRKGRIACASLNSVADLLHHPHLQTSAAAFADSTIELARLPVSGRMRELRKVPTLDQDGPAIRREFAASIRMTGGQA
ncbi:CaiB/BaiF CoA transferase family protein [Limoniibacter endophyticus]|uniref:CoA transferase n=1 Tax=Limoniibacter endophyticus TaxID=1565040 RepID=A0A8J3DKN0_9HYPH|nr:CaiB/BaiF CoA-transferase family protein [Limoniibacter endophyticus]GHC78200.1 CoA transferase [Limoniibacter endophyticus]